MIFFVMLANPVHVVPSSRNNYMLFQSDQLDINDGNTELMDCTCDLHRDNWWFSGPCVRRCA